MIQVHLYGYGTDTPTSLADIEGEPQGGRVALTEYVTAASWRYTMAEPYEDASVTLTVPWRVLKDIFKLGSEVAGGAFNPHASGWLEIRESVPQSATTQAPRVEYTTSPEVDTVTVTAKRTGGYVRRFLGPVSAVHLGVTAQHNGAIETAPVTITATSWVSLAQRTLRLTASDTLVRGSLINVDTWGQIVEGVLASATGVTSLYTSLVFAWYQLLALFRTPLTQYETLAGVGEPLGDPLERPPGMNRTLTPVQGFNLTQIQVPSLRVSVWGTVTSTWQAAPELVDMFPVWHGQKAYLIYRLKPLPPSLFVSTQWKRPSFVNVTQRAPRTQAIDDVFSVNLSYESARANFVEVTSPFVGVTQAAGVSCDPVALLDDIERHGLHEVSLSYPYFRASEGADGTVRAALNEMVDYAAALYLEGHKYARATVSTKYSPNLLHGEWARFPAHLYGESQYLLGYITEITHSVQVLPSGAVRARTQATLERVSVKGEDLAVELETSR